MNAEIFHHKLLVGKYDSNLIYYLFCLKLHVALHLLALAA